MAHGNEAEKLTRPEAGRGNKGTHPGSHLVKQELHGRIGHLRTYHRQRQGRPLKRTGKDEHGVARIRRVCRRGGQSDGARDRLAGLGGGHAATG